MNLLHISDTHGKHEQLKLVNNVDICIHSGDATNYHDVSRNFHEFESFVDWYSKLDIPTKIYIAGNHDSTLYNMRRDSERLLRDSGIEYLNYDSLTIGKEKIFGYPTTPRFGQWYFMADRSKMDRHCSMIPDDTTILINHGMPKGILDLTEDVDRKLQMVGCSNLFRKTQELKNLRLFCGGHIHNNKHIINTGMRRVGTVTYLNSAMVTDGEFEKESKYFHGNYITLD